LAARYIRASARALPVRAVRSGGALVLLLLGAAQRGEEEGLVDTPVEDRDPQFHALGYHLLPLHLDLVGELGGREVVCHSYVSSGRVPLSLRPSLTCCLGRVDTRPGAHRDRRARAAFPGEPDARSALSARP